MRPFFAASVLVAGCLAGLAGAQEPATVSLDPSVRYQTIQAWGVSMNAPPTVGNQLRDQLLDEAVNDLGLTRLRFEIPRDEWEYPYNDNNDPSQFDPAAAKPRMTDIKAGRWVVPFRERVEARGDRFTFYVSPSFFLSGSTGPAPDWMMQRPDEYAEWATAQLLYLRQRYKLVADYYCICNEAGNNNAFSPKVVAQMIKALGPRLQAAGLPTTIEFPECVNAQSSWRYIQDTKNDAEMWKYVGLVTYHLYGDSSQRPLIRDFAVAKGLPTGQTEFMGTTIRNLFDDLTEGGVSVWEHYGLAGPWGGDGTYFHSHLNGTSFHRYVEYWNFRQVMHYVRPGAVRIKADSSLPEVRAVAFEKDGKSTVVVLSKANQPQAVSIQGLAPGRYGLTWSTRNQACQEMGVVSAPDGMLQVRVPASACLTVWPHPEGNLPPTVTDWSAKPDYLTQPAATTTLSASATDPENDGLSYAWSIKSQPAGAQASLASPSAAKTAVSGLSVPGEYAFTVAVSDGTNTVRRDVILPVYADNQPPVIVDLHNRLPVLVVLPQSSTELRGGGLDLEGDKLTYKWTSVSAPAGAEVVLGSPDAGKCKASGLTVAGDYVFRFEVSDGRHKVSRDLTVTVYPAGRLSWPGTR